MLKRKLYRSALMAAVAGCGLELSISSQAGAATTWLNSGTSWLDAANWTSNSLPSSTNTAFLQSISGGSIRIPNIGSASASAKGISIDNGGGGVYSINGTGSISLGNSGSLNSATISVLNGGTTIISPTLSLASSGIILVGPNTTLSLAGSLGADSALTLAKDGTGTLQFKAAALSTSNLTFNINAGTVVVTNNTALGSAASISVGSGAALQLDLSTPANELDFGDANTRTTLENGSTLRGIGNSTLTTALFGQVLVENAAAVTINVPNTDSFLALPASVRNSVDLPFGTSSSIHVTGLGVLALSAPSTGTQAYTGGWNIDHGSAGGITGITYINDPNALGLSTAGVAAAATLTTGYLSDVRSDAAHQVPNPIFFNGGVLGSTSSGSLGHSTAYFNGSIAIQGAGGTIDMSDTAQQLASSVASNMMLSGLVSGSGNLFITAPTLMAGPTQGIATLSNSSIGSPNSESGNFIVQWNAGLAATTTSSGSDPLGTASVTLAGGELRLNHPDSGSNNVITTFSGNDIMLRGYSNGADGTLPTKDGTITLGNAASGNTGNTIVLRKLTFDTTGTSVNQTLAVQNAVGGVNYKARFDGSVTLGGNATITTGANPANIELNNRITGTGNLFKAGNNTLTLSGISNGYVGGTTVTAGTLVFNATNKIGTLTVNNGAQAVVSSGGNKFLKVTSLSITGTGVLDLTDEDAIIANGSLTTVRSLINNGFAGSAWTGTGGITSSSARSVAANPGIVHKTGLGYATVSQTGVGSFAGETVIASDLLIRYTLYGDGNLDGVVNSSDFSLLAANFGTSSRTWYEGDYNYDGTVNSLDFNALASNFGSSQPSQPIPALPSFGSVVPEPGAMGMLVAGFTLLRRRSRRHSRSGNRTDPS